MFRRLNVVSTVRFARKFSTEAPKTPAPVIVSGGSTFLQRFTSFLVGVGVGFGTSFYFIYQELLISNSKFEEDIKELKAKL